MIIISATLSIMYGLMHCNCVYITVYLWHTFITIDTSMTEEAARLIVKKHRRTRFGELTNKRKYSIGDRVEKEANELCTLYVVKPSTWKERLYILERLDKNSSTLAAGSYQNIALSRDR